MVPLLATADLVARQLRLLAQFQYLAALILSSPRLQILQISLFDGSHLLQANGAGQSHLSPLRWKVPKFQRQCAACRTAGLVAALVNALPLRV